MRVTNKMMNNNLLMNLNRGLTRLERINNQLGTKKKINAPSDDPVKTELILRTSTSIRQTEQYIRNIGSAVSWLDATDVVLQDVVSVIHRAKDLAVSGASTHLDDTARKALADEVAQLRDNLMQLANSTHGGRYLFARQHTDSPPFTTDPNSTEPLPDVEYLEGKGDSNLVQYEIGEGVTMEVSVDGDFFLGIFSALKTLHEDLTQSGRAPDDVLGDLDDALDGVLSIMSEIGGKQNRVDLAQERLQDLQLNLTKILSEEQDLDYAEAIMELKMEEFAYRTALAVGARIIQPSLVDFLR
ncbi:MAG TPA: flagellar hook-associated protein FlgL [Firmicutes bacterium]|jgi:flagellar hook-associated protein 3 FlgL|nr:flagellar hook-associated protein FlgL [Bacillota bacterium]